MIAALFVQARGVYAGRVDVDPWDEVRDARTYAGPYSVVAHPPCSAWGKYARRRVDSPGTGPLLGDDGGCFEAALASVRRWGGVLEHPAHSAAFYRFGLQAPTTGGGWSRLMFDRGFADGWVCEVEQGHYGHRARKATWLYFVGERPPPMLPRGKSVATIGPRPGRDPERERRIGAVQRMCRRERAATPPAFAELLIGLARGARE